jgi:transcriptional regulator with PAS, ATPase and Fis domain
MATTCSTIGERERLAPAKRECAYAQYYPPAETDKPGLITKAEGGTIFLDEIGDLPGETQVKLLRLLQERQYHPLGGVKTLKADVRIVAATNRDLSSLVSLGR